MTQDDILKLLNRTSTSARDEMEAIIRGVYDELKKLRYSKQLADKYMRGAELSVAEKHYLSSIILAGTLTQAELLTLLFETKQKFIERVFKEAGRELTVMQETLFNDIVDEFISKAEISGGKLVTGRKSFAAVSDLNSVMDDFVKTYTDPFIKGMGERMIETTVFDKEYYAASDIKKATLDNAMKKVDAVKEMLGVDDTGKLKPTGYLKQVAKIPEVRSKIINYVQNNVASGGGVKKFRTGLKEIVAGKGNILERYVNQFAFDTFNKVDELSNSYFAENAGLSYFIYAGTIIETSRCFCVKRAGNVYNVADTKTWQQDPTLAKSLREGSYNPVIDRGGYNCRHMIRYISETLAKEMGYNKQEAAAMVGRTCPDRK